MPRLVRIVLIVVLVLVVAVIALPFLIPMDSYRGTIAAAISDATGREVRIDGPLRLSIFPELGVSAAELSIANLEGAREPEMISVGELIVGVRLLPLLSRRVEVTRLILEEPVIHLEMTGDGTPNWEFETDTADVPDAEIGVDAGAPAVAAGGAAAASAFGIEALRISDGQVTYFDASTGTSTALDAIDMDLEMPSANAPLTLAGSLTYNGTPLDLDVQVDQPSAVLGAEGSAARLALTSNVLSANYDGSLAAAGRSEGHINLETDSLRRLADWSGNPLPPGDNLGATTLEAEFAAEDKRASFSQLRLMLDDMTITGDLTLDASAPMLALSGGIAIDRLDLNNYLVTSDPARGDAAPAAGASTTPIELGLLGVANADLTLSVGELLAQNLRVERAAVGVNLNNGLLNADLREMMLYGGMGRGTLIIDARGATPAFHQTLRVADMQIAPFLTDFMAVDRIEGTGMLDLDVTTSGSNQAEIMSALGGTANLSLANGAIRGVDLAAVARVIQNAVNAGGLGDVTGADSETEFTEAGGTFAIAGGIAHNNDFHLVNPVVSIEGNGDIDLAQRTLDFHLEPRPAAAGNVGGVDVANLGIAFRVHGPWTGLQYEPDVRSLATGALQRLLGRDQDTEQESDSQNLLSNTGDALRSLFGGGQ